MNSKFKFLTSLTLVSTLGLAIVGCGSSGGSNEVDGPSGTVTWYTAHNPEQNDVVVAGFEKLYPNVEVEVLRLVTGELAVRYAQERQAGSSQADILSIADKEFVEEGLERDWWNTGLQPTAGYPDDYIDQGAFTTGIFPLYLGYNTDIIPEGKAPDSWEDLLDPSFKDQILLVDPRNVPAYLAQMQVWSEEYGDDFLASLGAQNLRIASSNVPGNETLGSGGAGIIVPNAKPAAQTIIEAGAPAKLVEFGPTTGIENWTVVPNDAANAENAELFYEYLSSKEGQEAFNGDVIVSVRKDAETDELPEGYVPLGDVLPVAQERRAEILKMLRIE